MGITSANLNFLFSLDTNDLLIRHHYFSSFLLIPAILPGNPSPLMTFIALDSFTLRFLVDLQNSPYLLLPKTV